MVCDDRRAKSVEEIYGRCAVLFDQGVFRCTRTDSEGHSRIYFAGGIRMSERPLTD